MKYLFSNKINNKNEYKNYKKYSFGEIFGLVKYKN
jgi:hypothetical protein